MSLAIMCRQAPKWRMGRAKGGLARKRTRKTCFGLANHKLHAPACGFSVCRGRVRYLLVHQHSPSPQPRRDPAITVAAPMFHCDLLNRRPYFHLFLDRPLLLQRAIETRPTHRRQLTTCARYSSCLAATSLPGFGRRCLLARPAAPLASSLDFLQGTFEKIHLHRLLAQQPLQLPNLLP